MISCIMPTYRRMRCVERSVSLFCKQDFKDCELIIYNTDSENPIILSEDFKEENIKVINNNTDLQTGEDYNNMGSIRRDSLSFASGKYYICWDDDDIFLPWNNRQCIDNISKINKWAWKPRSSMARIYHNKPKISQNVMEASIISILEKVKEIGYELHLGGGEHMRWVKELERNQQIKVDNDSIPAYSFNWSDPSEIGGHKNSGSINHEDNFNIHKKQCLDKHTRPLQKINVEDEVKMYVDLLKNSIGQTIDNHKIEQYFYDKYVREYE